MDLKAKASSATAPGAALTGDAGAGTPPPPLERQLAMLCDLAEAGMVIAFALRDQITAAPAAGKAHDLPALALAFDRVARAVRMAIALEVRLLGGEGLEAERAAERTDGAREQAAEQEGLETERLEPVERGLEARERPETDSIYRVIENHSAGEVIAFICRDLGLPPDWLGLADDAGAREEIERAAMGSLLAGVDRPARERPRPKPIKPPERWPRAASP